MNNSVKEMIDVLETKPFLTENELTYEAFRYDRNTSRGSNKKYADMLRRGLRKGIIKRYSGLVRGKKAKYFYYLPGQEYLDFGDFHPHSYIINKYKDEKPMCNLEKEIEKITSVVNNIAETHNLYLRWENSEITDVDFTMKLLKLSLELSSKDLLPFHGDGWVEFVSRNMDTVNALPKTSSGSFYTSLIDFDNYFQDSFFENLIEKSMLEPTDERVEELYEFASKEYSKIRPYLYTSEIIFDRPMVEDGAEGYLENTKDIPGFEGTLDKLNNLTNTVVLNNLTQDSETKTKVEQVISMLKDMEVDGETMQHILEEIGMDEQMFLQLSNSFLSFKTYIGAPGNELV